jgi:hypothetical protein
MAALTPPFQNKKAPEKSGAFLFTLAVSQPPN